MGADKFNIFADPSSSQEKLNHLVACIPVILNDDSPHPSDGGMIALLAVRLAFLSSPTVIVDGKNQALEGIKIPYEKITEALQNAGVKPLGPQAFEFKDTNNPATILDNLLGGVHGYFARKEAPPLQAVLNLARKYSVLADHEGLEAHIARL